MMKEELSHSLQNTAAVKIENLGCKIHFTIFFAPTDQQCMTQFNTLSLLFKYSAECALPSQLVTMNVVWVAHSFYKKLTETAYFGRKLVDCIFFKVPRV